MNAGHDDLDSELQRLIRGCPEPERLSDERRQAIWQVMAARLEQTSAGGRKGQATASPAESPPASHPSMADEVIRPIQQVEIAPGIESRKSRFMHSRALKWAIPVAAAAAILLAVGVWPRGDTRSGKPQPGRVYAFSEFPALVRSAQTFHVHGMQTMGTGDGKYVELPIELWHSASGAYRSWRISTHKGRVDFSYVVCDGTHQMIVNDASKSVSFERITPFQTRILFLTGMQNLLFGNRFLRLDDFARKGTEVIDGRACEIWESEGGDSRGYRKCWFDPSAGVLARAETWEKDSGTGHLRRTFLLDKVERNIDAPPGIFDTTPPADYQLANTKETAPLAKLVYAQHSGPSLERTVYIGFVLPDGSTVLPWSVREVGKDEPQDSLFEGLVAGGEFPKLPIEIYALTSKIGPEQVTCTGRHLTWTRKDGQCIEWGLYVPDRHLPNITWRGLLTRQNPPDRALKKEEMSATMHSTIEVTASDFDELVLGAMAELSDSGAAPAGITYEGVTRLAQQIRASLGSQ